MRMMILSFAIMAVISVGASFGLQQVGFSSAESLAGPSVRLD
ncbi:MAG: hypothetical protein ACJA1L_000445 [Paracoccaceae bacterium]|jgi:hypothetical protein